MHKGMLHKMRQQAWLKWTSILLAAAIAAGSPAGFAAAAQSKLPMEGATETRVANALAMEELAPSVAPLGAEVDLPSAAAESADAGISEPQPRSLKSETRTDGQYSMAELNSLSYEELTDLLVSIEWRKIPELFKYNDDTRLFTRTRIVSKRLWTACRKADRGSRLRMSKAF